MPSASATIRSASAPKGSTCLLGQLDNAFDGKPCAAQAVAQGLPPFRYADRVRLQQPTHDCLIGRRAGADPERTSPVQEALRLLQRHFPIAQVIKCSRPPSAQGLDKALRPIAGLYCTGIVAAQEPDDAVVAPF